MQRQIFRQVALERLSSPEQLDQLVHVTRLRGWLALLALLCVLLAALIWGWAGRISTSVAGSGVLVRGERIIALYAPGSGQVDQIHVQPGQRVALNQPLITISNLAALTTTLLSPADGQILELGLAPGMPFGSATSLMLLEDRAQPLQTVIYLPVQAAAQIQPTMAAQITLAGGSSTRLAGRVISVGSFPASTAGMLQVLAHDQLVRSLDHGQPALEVRIAIDADPATLAQFSSGTLCQVQITIAEQRPISLLGWR